ncbi:M48 family metallopeptidase [Myceligenerans indicum]|uniref:M48 family metalloprotease n=1 Tax=Myceligenerans indicum TaxID=2593663 RepID=A0ABS1LPK4_9MICO|nr:M48 family metallopeptidase [Myceligenerans indicum]MBL0888216.1 M48 family metalloprotease [Myceligenerans indicum]
MSATMRALTSLAALIGFYLFALAIIAGLMIGGVLLTQASGPAGLKVILVAGVAAVGVVIALWKVATFKPEPAPGIDVGPDEAPELWQLVGRLAQTVGTQPPAQIRLVPDLNAAVSEDTRMLGLIGGTRRLYLGVPLLQGLTVTQLSAVLAHELGHYSGSHTRLGPLAYRGREAVVATVQQVGGVIGFFLKQYAKLYILLSQSMSRSQEVEADRLMVQIAGRPAAQGALRELPVLDAAWSFYTANYISMGWEDGLAPAPEEFFTGFGRLLAGRGDELAAIRGEAAPAEKSKWDSHPPIAERIAAMDRIPDSGSGTVPDERPAAALIPDFAARTAAVADTTVAYAGKERLSWSELVHRGGAAANQRTADTVYRAAARLTGRETATLSSLLELAQAGRLGELVQQVAPGAPPEASREVIAVALRAGAVQAGAARYEVSWTGPAVLADRSGSELDLEEVAALAVDPGTVRQAAERIAQLGIDAGGVGLISTEATAHGGDVVGGIADMKVDGTVHDMLILDNGLILAKRLDKRTEGKHRLVALAQSGTVAELARRHTFIPYENVAAAELSGGITVRATLTLHDGGQVTLKEPMSADRLSKESADVFRALLGRYVRQPA